MEENVCFKPRKKERKKKTKFIKPQLDEIEEEEIGTSKDNIYYDAAQSVFYELTNTLLQGSTTDNTKINEPVLEEITPIENVNGEILNEKLDFIDHETSQLLPINKEDAAYEPIQKKKDLVLETEEGKKGPTGHLPPVLETVVESDINISGDNKCPVQFTSAQRYFTVELKGTVEYTKLPGLKCQYITFFSVSDSTQNEFFQPAISPWKNIIVTKCANIQTECALKPFGATQLKVVTEIEILKPSVFIDKGKSHSLEISYQWDRKKYNPVLKPDLSKVIYPDLDLLLNWTQPVNVRHYPKNADNTNWLNAFYSKPNIGFDRNLKPQPVRIVSDLIAPPKVTSERPKTEETNADSIASSVYPSLSIHQTVECDGPKNKLYSNNPPTPTNVKESPSLTNKFGENLTDLSTRKMQLKVYMNPLMWSPMEEQQLLLFEVNSVYYEEFFSKCGSTQGLIESIKARAKELSDKQKQLQARKYTPPSSSSVSPQTIYIKDFHTVKIHSLPAIWKQKNEKRHVLFEVGGIFYEEDFTHCQSNLELTKALKERAECLLEQQQRLKYKAAWTDVEIKENTSLSEDDDVLLSYVREDVSNGAKNIGMSSDSDVDESNSSAVTSGRKTMFQSFKNWIKNPFRKKSVKKQDAEPNVRRIRSCIPEETDSDCDPKKTDQNKHGMERLGKCKSYVAASVSLQMESQDKIPDTHSNDKPYYPQFFLPSLRSNSNLISRRYSRQNKIGRFFQR